MIVNNENVIIDMHSHLIPNVDDGSKVSKNL